MQVDAVRFTERADRTEYMVHHFGRHISGAVLDVGCDRAVLKDLVEGLDYLGIDVAGEPDMTVNLEQVERLPFEDGQFDCVVCTDVLEHLDNLHAIFDELLRVSRSRVVMSLPNCWALARVPIRRGRGSFSHYGLPTDRPMDRHKWFFSAGEAVDFVAGRLANRSDGWRILAQRACEKPQNALVRGLRRLRYPHQMRYLNRYARTLWFVLGKGD